jgi:hypothetical protein
MQMGTNRKWVPIANWHHSQLPMAPIAITLIDEYYDRVRVRLGYLTI